MIFRSHALFKLSVIRYELNSANRKFSGEAASIASCMRFGLLRSMTPLSVRLSVTRAGCAKQLNGSTFYLWGGETPALHRSSYLSR